MSLRHITFLKMMSLRKIKRTFKTFFHLNFYDKNQFLVDDHSRVVLKFQRDKNGSDYINANFIDVRIYNYLCDL